MSIPRPALALCLVLPACGLRPPIPSLVIGLRSTRTIAGEPSVDHALSLGLVGAARLPDRPVTIPSPPSVPRAQTTARCVIDWLCAWERVQVARAMSLVAGALR